MYNLIEGYQARLASFTRLRWSFTALVVMLLVLPACGSSTSETEKFEGRWRESGVSLQVCEIEHSVLLDLELSGQSDRLIGDFSMLDGRTGLLIEGQASGEVDDSDTLNLALTTTSTTLASAGVDLNQAATDFSLTLSASGGGLTGNLSTEASQPCPDDAAPDDAINDVAVSLTAFTPRTGLNPADNWRDEVIYFALTDRFSNGDTSNDDGANRPAANDQADQSNVRGWYGGDFAGIEAKISEGYFTDLGVTAIWISPVKLQIPAIDMRDYANVFPEDVWNNDSGIFAGFHGYWAEDFIQVDPHFGSLGDLLSLIDTAHANNIKIIQDVVVNHTGYDATLLTTQPTWFHTAADCEASDVPDQDCELARLPDLNQDIPEVTAWLNAIVDYYVETFGIDGIRMDTVKHVNDSYWAQFFGPGEPGDPSRVWLVGEIFTGDIPFLASYLNDVGLPAVFDFPLYYRINDHLSSSGGSLNDIAEIFDQDSLYDDPTRLVTFVDNHDVQRFMTRTMNNGISREDALERLDMALSLIFIARGAPSIYYGTEIGLEGENDPQNRDLMDFSQLGQSDLDERISALASARDQYRALTHGAQQMLSRPSDNGANVMAFRRTLEGEPSVVIVMNNADEAVDLSQIAAGGIPLLGTFASDANLTEVSGRQTDVSIVEGLLVGTIPARSVIAVAGAAGSTTGGSNEGLETVTNVTALPGGAAVKLSWTPVTDDDALGYRIYYMPSAGGARVQSNFAPLGVGVDSTVVRGLDNGISYDFEVVTVDGDGRESTNNPTVTATPDADAVSSVTFVVDARSQGNAPMQIRRFDTGSEIRYPMTPVAGQRGFYETTLELPLFREISFKFANDAATAKNGGYEGVGTNNRTLLLDESTLRYEGVYNFIEGLPPGMPDAAVTGTVTSLDAPVANALIDAALDDRFYFAFTFEDGTFYLPLPSDTATTLTASAPGLTNASLEVTAPADDVMLELAPPSTRYTIDGDLSDWDGVPVLVNGPEGFDFGFGANNLFIDLYADADDDYLYLGYRYRAEGGNAMIVFVDSVDGGVQTMNELDAFAKWVTFTAGIDAIVAQDGGGVPSVRRLVSTTETMSEAGITATVSTGEDEFAFASEVAIPWAALGLDAKPASIDLYAGVFGGSLYGAGDIVPNRNSTPVAEGNTIQPQYDGPTPRLAEFETPLQVMLD